MATLPQDANSLASFLETHHTRWYYEELRNYLGPRLESEPVTARFAPRQKLVKLTAHQFDELSTDVYDEVLRRKYYSNSNPVTCLPERNDFHPKRNQARQKLATLPASRFADLLSDVFYDLGRRYPELKDKSLQ
ncbi:hypothetical protein BV25DRAFT_953444 [Artomyces pyxidatus]|uniref:Uncharacterized protein n=1 Tax=Artomyces pyxidatus TaxID=48021 RepID=A0ACB8SV56_9AGAM|nr:hypothetical protein BV25DRAFT_953444 [Artomyces pyxidatus]